MESETSSTHQEKCREKDSIKKWITGDTTDLRGENVVNFANPTGKKADKTNLQKTESEKEPYMGDIPAEVLATAGYCDQETLF